MSHHGSCHCGRIAFELEADVTEAIDCNCSLCRRRGGLLAFFPRAAFTLTTPDADLGTYRFNQGHIAHHFCPTCGVAPFSDGVHPTTGAAIVAVNLRCLPEIDLATLTVKQVDGASL
ncbi:MAG: GFA family protein [Proteobacteria bacterium]|nr:GFA family protein [Pseudomonadota bacterium]